MRGFGMNKNNPPNTFANRFWHSDTCLDVEMNKSKYFMEYIPKYYAESRKTPEDILHFICIHFPDLFNIFHPIDLFSLWCAGLCGLGGAGRGGADEMFDVWSRHDPRLMLERAISHREAGLR